MPITRDHLRRYAIARSLFKPTTLMRAIERLGFVQADPIRAPARAQDLTLRHRVRGYRAGDLERRYRDLPLEEDFFVNYGFLPRATQCLMHPRQARTVWVPERLRQAEEVRRFVERSGPVHPRAVDAHFGHGKAVNWFGGTSNASTQLLDGMHYRGMLRVAWREGGTRVYAPLLEHGVPPVGEQEAGARLDRLLDVIVHTYAPLPAATLTQLLGHLRVGAPQWSALMAAALARGRDRWQQARVDGVQWYWPVDESAMSRKWRADADVRLLTPFDPVVWDRRRFELFWGWSYRFEAYTPAAKRKLGYYALPLLWGEQIIGWGNVSVVAGRLQAQLGYVAGKAPGDKAFAAGLEQELARMEAFLQRA